MVLKSRQEIGRMDAANRIVHRVLDGIAQRVELGVTTRELDRWAEATIRAAGGVPAFLGYRGFPASLCTSVNEVVVHGIPDQRPLEEGDLLGVDCGVQYQGYYGDAARTYPVGRVDVDDQRLLAVTREALERAVDQARVGRRLSDLGAAVQRYVEGEGFSVVRDFTGHGIGTSLHEDPEIPNHGRPGRGPRLRAGMVLAIEPMVNAGQSEVVIDEDGWTARTADGTKSAHFEFSVAVTDEGPLVLGVNAKTERRPPVAPAERASILPAGDLGEAIPAA